MTDHDPRIDYLVGDCLWRLPELPPASVDLVFCSPPYESRRSYGVGFDLRGEAWVAWALERFHACLRVTKPRGLVCWVVNGCTERYRWSATPLLLAAELHRAGVCLRKPPIYHRVGIPGSGGPDWFRDDYEFAICATPERGKLGWSDNTACGEEPRFPVGGAMSNRTADGSRRNARTGTRLNSYRLPERANPGNVIHCKVGGGLIGDRLAHRNEAPFPERLAERFIRSCCPPGGTVLDCFAGSGTTGAVAKRWGRNAILMDLRHSQIRLARERVARVAANSGVAERAEATA